MKLKYGYSIAKTIHGIEYDMETAEHIAEYLKRDPVSGVVSQHAHLFQQEDHRFYASYLNHDTNEMWLEPLSKFGALYWLQERGLESVVESVKKRPANQRFTILVEETDEWLEARARNGLTRVYLSNGEIVHVMDSLEDGARISESRLDSHPLAWELFEAEGDGEGLPLD